MSRYTGTYDEYRADFVRRFVTQGRYEGEAKGVVRAVLGFLAARGIDVPDDVRGRIEGCTDLDHLDVWIHRAAVAEFVHDLSRTNTPRESAFELAECSVQHGRNEGEAKGQARAVLGLLVTRGVNLPDEACDRVTSCTDLDQLDVWVRRAATAQSVDDLFDE